MTAPSVPGATARLRFRLWRDDDMPLARALFGDPRVTALVGGPFDDTMVRERLAFELTNQREHGIAYWPIATHDGTHVGCCGLKPRAPARRIFELGFYLLPEHWANGFAVEAGTRVIEHAFGALAASELFAGHHPDNHGSRRTLEKLGFTPGPAEFYVPTGLVHPGYVRVG